MDVRDAVEADAERMAELTDAPVDVMRNLVHDRTVRVAVERDSTTSGSQAPGAAAQSGGSDGGDSAGGDREAETVIGFVSFDAQRETVHVTQLEGSREVCETLLEEPLRFARTEGMSVELLAAQDDDALQAAAEAAGFADHGPGPRFDDTRTVRYRLDPV